jgi:Stage V sporulation protein S (SpoVS)
VLALDGVTADGEPGLEAVEDGGEAELEVAVRCCGVAARRGAVQALAQVRELLNPQGVE